jgi:hypothetical protein
MHVLEKYSPAIAENISRTYNSYEFPRETLLFGSLFGENIPDEIKAPDNIVVVNTSESVIIYRRHQGNSEKPDASDYTSRDADTLSYRALDEYQFGDKAEAKTILEDALDYWDGLGFNDRVAKKEGLYTNFKIGLFLYVADKMNYPLSADTRAEMERQMWRQQSPETGGIASFADLNGRPFGSANVESTALTLLPYTIRE